MTARATPGDPPPVVRALGLEDPTIFTGTGYSGITVLNLYRVSEGPGGLVTVPKADPLSRKLGRNKSRLGPKNMRF